MENYDESCVRPGKSIDVLALEFAAIHHAGQFDEDNKPVICHPITVAGLVEGGEKERAAAYLHDVLEDTDASEAEMRKLFGDEITDAVVADTRQEGEDYFDYIERVKKNPIAVKVKLADLKHNLSRETDKTSKRYKTHEKAYADLVKLI